MGLKQNQKRRKNYDKNLRGSISNDEVATIAESVINNIMIS